MAASPTNNYECCRYLATRTPRRSARGGPKLSRPSAVSAVSTAASKALSSAMKTEAAGPSLRSTRRSSTLAGASSRELRSSSNRRLSYNKSAAERHFAEAPVDAGGRAPSRRLRRAFAVKRPARHARVRGVERGAPGKRGKIHRAPQAQVRALRPRRRFGVADTRRRRGRTRQEEKCQAPRRA